MCFCEKIAQSIAQAVFGPKWNIVYPWEKSSPKDWDTSVVLKNAPELSPISENSGHPEGMRNLGHRPAAAAELPSILFGSTKLRENRRCHVRFKGCVLCKACLVQFLILNDIWQICKYIWFCTTQPPIQKYFWRTAPAFLCTSNLLCRYVMCALCCFSPPCRDMKWVGCQGCQMVYFNIKYPHFDLFWTV
jgi:hypothetical protein